MSTKLESRLSMIESISGKYLDGSGGKYVVVNDPTVIGEEDYLLREGV